MGDEGGSGPVFPDDAVVLRGGSITDADGSLNPHTWKNYVRVRDAYGFGGLCATAGNGDPGDLAGDGRSQHPELRWATVGDLRRIEFDVILEPEHDPPDALIVPPVEVTPEHWCELESVLATSPPIENPKARKRKE